MQNRFEWADTMAFLTGDCHPALFSPQRFRRTIRPGRSNTSVPDRTCASTA
ncbi:hypothetical protein [Fulvimonas soli]|uniref:hypothetical protein n=1 Tax=Fulvimonas soli TaxID=155197 RepID=UPI0014754D81|nr:hypothetical protein [Fulvimonas soli]